MKVANTKCDYPDVGYRKPERGLRSQGTCHLLTGCLAAGRNGRLPGTVSLERIHNLEGHATDSSEDPVEDKRGPIRWAAPG